MRVAGSVDAQSGQVGTSRHATGADVQLGLRLPCRGERQHRRNGRCVVEESKPTAGQAEHLAKPIGGDLLELRGGWRRTPELYLHIQRGDEQLADDARYGRRRGEVAEEAGMIPMRDARNNLPLEIAQNLA